MRGRNEDCRAAERVTAKEFGRVLARVAAKSVAACWRARLRRERLRDGERLHGVGRAGSARVRNFPVRGCG